MQRCSVTCLCVHLLVSNYPTCRPSVFELTNFFLNRSICEFARTFGNSGIQRKIELTKVELLKVCCSNSDVTFFIRKLLAHKCTQHIEIHLAFILVFLAAERMRWHAAFMQQMMLTGKVLHSRKWTSRARSLSYLSCNRLREVCLAVKSYIWAHLRKAYNGWAQPQ